MLSFSTSVFSQTIVKEGPEKTNKDEINPDSDSVKNLLSNEPQQEIRIIDEEMEGKTITSFIFSCDLPVCENDNGLSAFREIAGLRVGEKYHLKTLRRAEIRLGKTGFFETLTIEKQDRNGIEIRIHAKGATLVRKVIFEGIDSPPFESDIRKLVTYRQGQRYVEDGLKVSSQLDGIRSLYKKEGFFGTKIGMFIRKVESKKHQVDIVFKIQKGTQRPVCSIGIRGVQGLSYAAVKELLLSNFASLPSRLNVFPTFFTNENFRKGREELIDAYRKRGYFQTRILRHETKIQKKENCVVLIVDLSEGPHWDVRFSGNKRFDQEELMEVLPFFESGYVDVQEIRRAEFAIRRLYETRGYPFAQVKGVEKENTNKERSIIFTIKEGPLVSIRSIRFEGNHSIDSLELKELMSTKVFGLFESGGYLQTDELLGDLSRIESYYQNKGWLSVAIRKFKIVILDEGIEIRIAIDEGEKVIVESLDIVGNRMVIDSTLKRSLALRKNSDFVPLELKADLGKMVAKYSEFGYPMARINTSCRLLNGKEVPCRVLRRKTQCVSRSLDEIAKYCSFQSRHNRYQCERIRDNKSCELSGGLQRRVRIRHHIDEGPRVRVGAILLRGNFDTNSSVIYREVPFGRNELLDMKKILEAQRNLRSLNIFDSVSVESIGLDEDIFSKEEGIAALVVAVEESRATRALDFKVGLELRELLSENFQLLVTGEGQYNDRNVMGTGIGIQPRLISAVDTLDLFKLGADAAVSGNTVQGVDYLIGAEIVLSHPRFLKSLLGIDKLKATLAPFYLLDLLGIINRNVLREEGGVRLEIRKELIAILSRLYFKFGVELKSIASFAPDGPVLRRTRIFSPRRSIGKITPEFVLDRRDSPLNPTKGYFLRVEPTLVSGDAFGQNGEDFFGDSFLKLTLTTSIYFNFWKKFVWGQSLRVGQVFPLASREKPVQADERYFLGGVRSVRGFPDGTLGPIGSNQQPSGGEFLLNYNTEFRYPLFEKYGIFGATFVDVGLLSDCRERRTGARNCYLEAFQEPWSQIRPTAGLGIRALILDQIPVVLDYGMVLNREPGEQFGEIHFNIGYTFD